MPRTRTSTPTTGTATCSRSTTTASRRPENIERYLEADLLDEYGFSEWVGPEPHGLGKHNTGTVKDVFTADETVELLQRLDGEESDQPWLTVCSFLNPHDDSLFGIIALTQGLRYHPGDIPAGRARADARGGPVDQAGLPAEHGRPVGDDPRAAAVDRDAPEVLLPAAGNGRRADHQGARRAARRAAPTRTRSWSSPPITATCRARTAACTRSGTTPTRRRRTCRSSSPVRCLPGGAREIDVPTSHADLLPTLLGLAGIDQDEAFAKLSVDHKEARPLIGRDLSGPIRAAEPAAPSEPLLFMTDDEISEGNEAPASPFQKLPG